MKKTVCIFGVLLLILTLANIACAAQKFVQLEVPGCFS